MRKGFTLVELLISVSLLAILAAIAIPVFTSVNSKAGSSEDSVTAESIEIAIDSWMNTDYSEDGFYRTNLFNGTSIEEAAVSRIGGLTEQMYSYHYAGTGQLPGVELTDEKQIRHSVITAIKATSAIRLETKDAEQFVKCPKLGSQYGFKYYYKIGRVNVEPIDASQSAFGNDEVYSYYVWLDRSGGVIDSVTVPKNHKNSETYYVTEEPLYTMTFDYGNFNKAQMRIVVEQEGMLSCTFDGITQTPAMFKLGTYNIYFYNKGDLVSIKTEIILRNQGQVISVS